MTVHIIVPTKALEANRMQLQQGAVPLTQWYADVKSDLASFSYGLLFNLH